MKRKTLLISGIATATVLALGGGYAYSISSNRPAISVAEAAYADLTATVSATGALTPAKSAGVYAPTAGTLTKVLVSDGDQVAADQVLATVATGGMKLAVAEARAAVSAAAAQLDAVNRGVPAAIERSAASAGLSAARSQVTTAGRNYSAYLADYKDASKSEREQMLPTLRTLKTAKATANASLQAAKAGISKLSRAAKVSLARAAATDAGEAAQRALKLAKANLAKAELKAPFAGTVQYRGTVEKGAGVAPGVAVLRVVDFKQLRFEAAVNETDIAQVGEGQQVVVTLDAFDQPFTGTVTRVHSDAQPTATGGVTFAVEVALETGDSRTFSGMTGSAEIATQTLSDTLAVPVAAVQTKGSSQVVFVVDAESVAHSREVRTGISTDSFVQVTDGLAAGERVAVVGAATLSDGQQVRVQ